MILYADTSVLLAWFHPNDEFAATVTPWIMEHVDKFYWNGILRAELRHNLRKLKSGYEQTAWNAYRATEQSQRLFMVRTRLESLLEDLDELSAKLAPKAEAGTLDFFHIVAALRAGSDYFATCDRAQAEVARLAGLKVKLFKI